MQVQPSHTEDGIASKRFGEKRVCEKFVVGVGIEVSAHFENCREIFVIKEFNCLSSERWLSGAVNRGNVFDFPVHVL